jgi:hypothetical protein
VAVSVASARTRVTRGTKVLVSGPASQEQRERSGCQPGPICRCRKATRVAGKVSGSTAC